MSEQRTQDRKQASGQDLTMTGGSLLPSDARVCEEQPEATVQQETSTTARASVSPESQIDLSGKLPAADDELSAFDAVSPVDITMLSGLLAATQKLLELSETGRTTQLTARALKRSAGALSQFRTDRRQSAHLPGKQELIQEAADLGTEIEMTLWDAIVAASHSLEDAPLDDPSEHIAAMGLVSSAMDALKRDVRAEAEHVRLLSTGDDDAWTDAELRFFASQTSVRERYREKRQRSKTAQAIFDSRRARKASRKAKREAYSARKQRESAR